MSRATTAVFLPAPSSPSGLPFEQVVGDEVAQGQRRHLHDVDVHVDVLEVLQVAIDHVALHGEQADLGLHREAVGDDAGVELLVVPDDLVEVEGDLLFGLEANDVADLLLFDGRQLDEAGQTALSGDGDGDDVAADLVARQELLQRLAGELIGVRVGLAEDLGMLDEIEGGGGDHALILGEADGLEAALAQVDAPHADGLLCHAFPSPTQRVDDASVPGRTKELSAVPGRNCELMISSA